MAAERGHSVPLTSLARREPELSSCLRLHQETGLEGETRGEGVTCCPLSLGSSLERSLVVGGAKERAGTLTWNSTCP